MSASDSSTTAVVPSHQNSRAKHILKLPSDLSPLNRARTRECRNKAVTFADGKAGLPLYEVRMVERPEADEPVKSTCCVIF